MDLNTSYCSGSSPSLCLAIGTIFPESMKNIGLSTDCDLYISTKLHSEKEVSLFFYAWKMKLLWQIIQILTLISGKEQKTCW
jgi:hypothetical protein